MADLGSTFEGSDTDGTTDQFQGSVGTAAISLPSIPGTRIAEVSVRNLNEINNLLFSFDGLSFKTLFPFENIMWSLKGNVKQIQVKSSSSLVENEGLINRETI